MKLRDMSLERVKIDALNLDPANARKHGDKNKKAIKGSIAAFNQQKPIVIDENNVVLAGNGTVEAAQAAGLTEIWVTRTNLQGADKRAYAVADNRTGELAAWDDDVLSETLTGLEEVGFDLDAIGFDDDDLRQWLGARGDDPIPIDIEPEPKEDNELKITCVDYNERLEAIDFLGGKKIAYQDLRARMAK